MYKIIWDIETNGVILTDKNVATDMILIPRPVFFEELDLLGFDKHWEYPKTKEPLLWANGRRYYYKGVKVAEARGGNIFEAPQIIIEENAKGLTLEPVNVRLMLENNREALFVLENEAMDFVEHTYKSYKKGRNKVDCFAVSFSGGKDSQVVLDIVSRVIPPDEYIVVFTDTDMELPSTYENVKETEAYYKKLYPELRFYTAKGRLSSEESWRKFGPPSRIHRWCCTVHKTAPYLTQIKSLLNEQKQLKVLTFDGVRSDESLRREAYKRMSEKAKHIYQINAEVIKYWNATEVFLYIFQRRLLLNKAYRYGMNRIGCSICPFASDQAEYIISREFPEIASKYVEIIKEHVSILGIRDKEKTNEYIAQGRWKGRGGGEGVNTNGTRIDFFSSESNLRVIISNPKESFFEWARTVGSLYHKKQDNRCTGEIKCGNSFVGFEYEEQEDKKIIFNFKNINSNAILLSKIKRVLYKSAYCIHCGTCEVECPTGALDISIVVKIKENLCTHCGNCLNFTDRGCLTAKSVAMLDGGLKKMDKKFSGFGRYLNFGIRKEWINAFLSSLDDWFAHNNLGPKQVESMIVWLRDAELLERKTKKITELSRNLQQIFISNEFLVWQIVWVNLYYNSNVVKWYLTNIKLGDLFSTKELVLLILNQDSSCNERTISSGIDALANMLETTPLGRELNLGVIEKRGGIRYIKKIGADNIHPAAIAYSLYRYAQSKNRRDFTVSEFYKEDQKEGPYRLFGISREKFENILRYLQEDKNGIIKVELGKGLDNIRLRNDLNYIEVLELLTQGKPQNYN